MKQGNREITRAAGTIGLATFASRILGFIRDMLLARLFGAGFVSDSFFVAFRIPSLLRELFAEGSMSSAFIPVYTETLSKQGAREAKSLAASTLTVLFLMVSLVTFLAMWGSPWIVRLIAPGFSEELGKFNLTVMLTRFMFPYLIFISLGALAMGILNSLKAFLIPALSPVIFNLVIISSAIFLSPSLTEPIFGVAIGVTLGGLAQFLIQVPSLIRRGVMPSFKFTPIHPGVKTMAWLVLPSMISLSVTQVNVLVSTILASFLEEGSLTYLFYGMRLVLFPLGIFAVAMGTAILPTLSLQAALGNMEDLRRTLVFGLRMIAFIIIPAMVGLMLLRIPIIHLFFEHGEFSRTATLGTASALAFYSLGLPAFAGIRIVTAAFFSLKDTKTPAMIAILAVSTNLGLSLALMGPMGHGGLALATSLSGLLNLILLVILLNKRIGGLPLTELGRWLGVVFLTSIPVGGIAIWISRLALWEVSGAWVIKSFWLMTGIGMAVFVYGLTHYVLKSVELSSVLGSLKKRS